MHEGALTLSDEAAARLIARRFPLLAASRLRRVSTAGTVNTIIRIGDDLVARFPFTAETETALASEGHAMSELGLASPVPTPAPYGVGGPSAEYASAWSVQSWLPGETAGHDSHATSAALAQDIADLIGSLRAADPRGRSFDGRGRGGVLADHDDWVTECLDRSGHLLDTALARRLWRVLRASPPAGPDVMSHRDLTPFNLLISDGRLVGVLDGGGFGPADRALDLVAAWHLFDSTRRRIVRDRLGAGEVEWRRGAAWALQQAMGLVWYYERSNRSMSRLGASTMARLLADDELAALL